jgi:hypothetical protein
MPGVLKNCHYFEVTQIRFMPSHFLLIVAVLPPDQQIILCKYGMLRLVLRYTHHFEVIKSGSLQLHFHPTALGSSLDRTITPFDYGMLYQALRLSRCHRMEWFPSSVQRKTIKILHKWSESFLRKEDPNIYK